MRLNPKKWTTYIVVKRLDAIAKNDRFIGRLLKTCDALVGTNRTQIITLENDPMKAATKIWTLLGLNAIVATILFIGALFVNTCSFVRSFYDLFLSIPHRLGLVDFFDIRTHDVLLGFSAFWLLLFTSSLPIVVLLFFIFMIFKKKTNKIKGRPVSD